jgi:hypothetical protein
MDIRTNLTFDYNGIKFDARVICLNENAFFSDDWRLTDTPEYGYTVLNVEAERNSFLYAVPLNTSFAEEIERFANAGYSNAEAVATRYLQNLLRRDLNASDYLFSVNATTADGKITLIDSEYIGGSFNYSYLDEHSLEERASCELLEIKGEIIERAVECAKDLVNGMSTITAFIEAQEKDDLL